MLFTFAMPSSVLEMKFVAIVDQLQRHVRVYHNIMVFTVESFLVNFNSVTDKLNDEFYRICYM